MPDWAWGIVAAVATAAGTGLARRYAISKQLLDQPGERRNHVTATPRGGGISMAVVLLLAIVVLALLHPEDAAVLGLMGLSLALVGWIGWWDDHRPLSAGLRLSVHSIAALCLFIAGVLSGWSWWLSVLAAIAAMSLINIWNFMDGIDGLAASQAVVVTLVIALAATGYWTAYCAVLAGAAFGFLCWNFPKARIFMGDVGSGLLGLALAWAWAGLTAQKLEYGLLMLFPLAPFLVDASLTLARRIMRGERWWEAHSSHSYQLLARRFGTHLPVTLGYLAATLIGAGAALALKSVKMPFILPALLAWYIALVIIWQAARRPAMDERSKE